MTLCSFAFSIRARAFMCASFRRSVFLERFGTRKSIRALGSVDAAVSVRERLAFWAKLPERLARLGNRVSSDEHAAIYAALHARLPMVTPDEQRAIQEENAKDDERFWDTMQEMNASSAGGHSFWRLPPREAQEHDRVAADATEERELREDGRRTRTWRKRSGGLGKKPTLTGN